MDDEFVWMYAKDFQMENIYIFLYYHFVDANMNHVRWRIMPTVDTWDKEEVLVATVDLLDNILSHAGLPYNNDFQKLCDDMPEIDSEYTHDALKILKRKKGVKV